MYNCKNLQNIGIILILLNEYYFFVTIELNIIFINE